MPASALQVVVVSNGKLFILGGGGSGVEKIYVLLYSYCGIA